MHRTADLSKAGRHTAAFIVALATLLAASSAWAQMANAPYLETFDNESTCSTTCTAACTIASLGWVQDANDDNDWIIDNNGTTSSNTGPSADHTTGRGGNYLYIEATGCASDTSNLLSPPIMVASTTTEARFWYHIYGSSNGELHVDISTDNGATFTNDVVPAMSGDLDQWLQQIVPLGAYNGQTVIVRLRGLTGGSFESDVAIDDFEVGDTGLNVGVSAIAPTGGCGATNMEAVTVDVTNTGIAAVSMVPISYSVDGGAPIMEMVPGPIAPSQTISYTFAAAADLSALGPHTITVQIALPNDGVIGDNSTSLSTLTAPKHTIAGTGSVDTLEAPLTPLFWTSGGAGNEWEWGTPTDALVGGTTSGTQAWATDLNSTYSSNSNNFLEALSCYDLTNVTNATIAVQINYDLEADFDGVVLQATTDGGTTWTTVGDAISGTNWYNSTAIASNPGGAGTGWTGDGAAGTNGSYVLAVTDLGALAGQSEVRFRFIMTSNGSFSDEGFAFDDFGIYDVGTPSVAVAGSPVEAPVAAVAPGATNVLVQAFNVTGIGSTTLAINSVTLTKAGTIMDADIMAARLWLDDGDGVFDPLVDAQLGADQTFAAGVATFNTVGQPALAEFLPTMLFVTYDLTANAMPGDTFGSSIAMATDVVEAAATTVTLASTPLAGPLLTVQAVLPPPIVDDFNSSVAARSTQINGNFPTATAVGTTLGTTSFPNDARIRIGGSPSTLIQPIDGPNVYLMDWPDGSAGGALDYFVDLSAYNAMDDVVLVQFRWAQIGEENANDAEYVFVSTDGGATWAAAIYDLDPSVVPDNQWQDVTLNLSDLFVQYSLTFTNNVVVRFQGDDDFPFNSDGYLYDRVFIGLEGTPEVERLMGTPIPSASTDNLGQITATTQSVMYTVNNVGDLPITIDDQSFATSALTNVSGVAVTPPAAPIDVPAGGSVMFQVDYTVDSAAAFSFDIGFDYTTAGLSTTATYTFTLAGDGVPNEPEIDIQRPQGTSIASGMTDAQGDVEIGMQTVLTYTIENIGFVDLNISGAAIANDNNVMAQITGAPTGTLGPMMSTTMEVTYSATAEGAFGFDIEVTSDDTDEGTYVVAVAGNGTDPNAGVGGGGATTTGAGGSTTTGTGGAGDGDTGDDGGCSCRIPNGETGGDDAGLIAIMGLAAALMRRRKRVA